MKKVIIAIVIIVIILASYLLINSNKNLDEVLSKYEAYEKDGYYANNKPAEGYVVSNKTQEGYRYGYVNYKGKILLDARYNHIHRVMEIQNKDKVYLIAAKDGRYGVNFNGKDIINYEYQFIEYNNSIEGFILQKSESYGVANIKGEIIIPVQNVMVQVKGKYIYVSNQSGNNVYNSRGEILEVDFNTSIQETENEDYFIKIVEEDQCLYGIVDKKGKELVKAEYLYIEYLFDNYFVASNEENEGIIDNKGNIKLEFKYNIIQKIQNTNLIRTLNSKTNETEIYSRNFEKICTMTNANIENDGNIIKIYNKEETKYFDYNGIEIQK